MNTNETYTELYAVLNPAQMKACKASKLRNIHVETPEQQYLFLKLNRDHAERIAHDWTAKHYGAAYVVRISVSETYLDRCKRMSIAYAEHEEYRVCASDLSSLHWYVNGTIAVMTVYWKPNHQPIKEVVSFG
ncbi:MAG: hypothetical protein AAF542_16385 [Pseudomonadota bacterium]